LINFRSLLSFLFRGQRPASTNALREPSAPSALPAFRKNEPPEIDATPDKPVGFGFKTNWFAIRDATPEAVLKALDFADAQPANWETGLQYLAVKSTDDHWVFVSPLIDQWVFIIGGIWMPHPARGPGWLDETGRKFDAFLGRLLPHFSDIQFFGSYRVTGFVAWMRAIDGNVIRSFAFNDAECWENAGVQTPEEAQLNFADISGLAPMEAVEKFFSDEGAHLLDEEDVVRLAALWSLDPSRLEEEDHEPGTGFLARFPAEWMA
jgi:hypothetical protein